MITLKFCNISILLKLFFDRYFLFYATSWLLIRFLRDQDITIRYLNDWLTDFVFVALVTHFTLCVGHFLLGFKVSFRYSFKPIALACLLTSIVFEIIAPKITNYNTADPIDVLMYFLGGYFYYKIHQNYTLKKILIYLEPKGEIPEVTF